MRLPRLRLPKVRSMVGLFVGITSIEGIVFCGAVILSLCGAHIPTYETIFLIALFPGLSVGWLVAK